MRALWLVTALCLGCSDGGFGDQMPPGWQLPYHGASLEEMESAFERIASRAEVLAAWRVVDIELDLRYQRLAAHLERMRRLVDEVRRGAGEEQRDALGTGIQLAEDALAPLGLHRDLIIANLSGTRSADEVFDRAEHGMALLRDDPRAWLADRQAVYSLFHTVENLYFGMKDVAQAAMVLRPGAVAATVVGTVGTLPAALAAGSAALGRVALFLRGFSGGAVRLMAMGGGLVLTVNAGGEALVLTEAEAGALAQAGVVPAAMLQIYATGSGNGAGPPPEASPQSKGEVASGAERVEPGMNKPQDPQKLGADLVKKYKAEGVGQQAGRSGGHGGPFKKAGAELIRKANELPKGHPLREAYKKEGQRLILKGKSISHPGRR